MKGAELLLLWFVDVALLSPTVAIFEIILEKDKGWATCFSQRGWGTRFFEGTLIARICEKPYLTAYHLLVFPVIVPVLLIAQISAIDYYLVPKWGGSMQIENAWAVQFLLLGAIWFSFISVEDFLWFALNWYYPGSLRRLLSGQVWWHTRWLGFGRLKLPRFYLSSQALAILFLLTSIYLASPRSK